MKQLILFLSITCLLLVSSKSLSGQIYYPKHKTQKSDTKSKDTKKKVPDILKGKVITKRLPIEYSNYQITSPIKVKILKGNNALKSNLHKVAIANIQNTKQSKQTIENNEVCVTEFKKVTLDNQENFILNPSSSLYYPGAVYTKKSILEGAPAEITKKKSPLNLSVSLEGLPQTYTTVDNPNSTSIFDAHSKLLNQNTRGTTGAEISYNFEKVTSKEEFLLKVKGHYSGFGAKVDGMYSQNTSSNITRYFLDFWQVYYTASIGDLPYNPSDFFTEPTTAEELNDWLVVKNVKYGRRIVLTMEFEDMDKATEAELKANYSGGIGTIKTEVNTNLKNALSKATIKAIILGGNSSDAVTLRNIEDVNQFLKNGANSSINSRGKPISYQLFHIKDNSLAILRASNEYEVKTCDIPTFRVTLKEMLCKGVDDSGSEVELFGHTKATLLTTVGEIQAVKEDINRMNRITETSTPLKSGCYLWRRKGDKTNTHIELEENQRYPFNNWITYRVKGLNLKDDTKLILRSQVQEHDGSSANDDCGWDDDSIYLKQLQRGQQRTIIQKFGCGGNELHFVVERIL